MFGLLMRVSWSVIEIAVGGTVFLFFPLLIPLYMIYQILYCTFGYMVVLPLNVGLMLMFWPVTLAWYILKLFLVNYDTPDPMIETTTLEPIFWG